MMPAQESLSFKAAAGVLTDAKDGITWLCHTYSQVPINRFTFGFANT